MHSLLASFLSELSHAVCGCCDTHPVDRRLSKSGHLQWLRSGKRHGARMVPSTPELPSSRAFSNSTLILQYSSVSLTEYLYNESLDGNTSDSDFCHLPSRRHRSLDDRSDTPRLLATHRQAAAFSRCLLGCCLGSIARVRWWRRGVLSH